MNSFRCNVRQVYELVGFRKRVSCSIQFISHMDEWRTMLVVSVKSNGKLVISTPCPTKAHSPGMVSFSSQLNFVIDISKQPAFRFRESTEG